MALGQGQSLRVPLQDSLANFTLLLEVKFERFSGTCGVLQWGDSPQLWAKAEEVGVHLVQAGDHHLDATFQWGCWHWVCVVRSADGSRFFVDGGHVGDSPSADRRPVRGGLLVGGSPSRQEMPGALRIRRIVILPHVLGPDCVKVLHARHNKWGRPFVPSSAESAQLTLSRLGLAGKKATSIFMTPPFLEEMVGPFVPVATTNTYQCFSIFLELLKSFCEEPAGSAAFSPEALHCVKAELSSLQACAQLFRTCGQPSQEIRALSPLLD
jgi:hypothetical protein